MHELEQRGQLFFLVGGTKGSLSHAPSPKASPSDWIDRRRTSSPIPGPGGGGGGGGYSPQIFARYVLQQSEKWARAPERAPGRAGRAWKCGAPERAWKCGAPERAWPWAVLSMKIKMWISGMSLIRFERENANLRNGRKPAAVGGDEWVEIKELLKMMVSGTGKIRQKNVKWWCSGTDFWVICENDMLRNGNSGLKWGSLAQYTPNMHTYGSIPLPGPPPLLRRLQTGSIVIVPPRG